MLCLYVACKGKVLVPEWKTTLQLARGKWKGEDVSSDMYGLIANQEDMDMKEDVGEGEPFDRSELLELLEYSLLYPEARCSRISAIMHIFKVQNDGNWSNVDIDKLFKVLNDILLPFNDCLPQNRYEAKKFLENSGVFDLSMKKYHACGNDCCLYYDNLEFAEECLDYEISR